MPSVAVTPASYELNFGTALTVPPRATVGRLSLHFTGGTVTAGPGTTSASAVVVPTLNRLSQYDQFPGVDAQSWRRFMAVWQELCQSIEAAFQAVNDRDTAQDSVLARLTAAEALANAANDNAAAVTQREALADSYTDPVSVAMFANTGTVTIAAHTRVYGDGTSVAVNGGSVSGFAAGNYVTVYYVDAGRQGGAVTYQATTSAIPQTGDTHIVAQGTIPAAGAPAQSGTSPSAPGYIPPVDDNPSYGEP